VNLNLAVCAFDENEACTQLRFNPAEDSLAMLSFQKLHVYQRSIEFLSVVVKIASETPRGHAPVLDQLKRAAMSIPLNIAEACGRSGTADAARTYAIARGSAMECAAVLDVLLRLGVLESNAHEHGVALLESLVAMLTKMCRPA
jgi:four helix bundle protein